MKRMNKAAGASLALLGTGLLVAGCGSQRPGNAAAEDTAAASPSNASKTQRESSRNVIYGAKPASRLAGTTQHKAAPVDEPKGQASAEGSRRFLPSADAAKSPIDRRPTSAAAPAPPSATYNPNMYVANTYIGGSGERDRLEKLILAGVVVDGQRVKLESFSRTYAQTFPIPTATALNLVADTERGKIVTAGDHTYLQIGLQAIKGESPRRAPLNIALVLDRSGSMHDENKLGYAKAAASRLVAALGPDDTFSLVAFDNEVKVLVPAQHVTDKSAVLRLIAGLTPGGGTNIYGGLQAGYAQIGKHSSSETVNRLILLSDGEVTAGVSDPEAFHRLAVKEVDRDIQTSAVGVGVEFNENLMLALARDGQGNYHFMKDGGDTQRVFAKELNELTHTVAKAVKLRIRLAEGVGLIRVLGAQTLNVRETQATKNEEKRMDRRIADELGIAPNRQQDPDEPGIKTLIPNFYRGDSHIVMLELAVPPGTGRRKLADVTLKYKDLVTRSNREAQASSFIEYTPNRADMIASIHRSVKKNLLGFQTGETLTDAANLIARGQVGEAVKRIDERMAVLGVASREWNDRDLDGDGRLLDRYKSVLTQLNRNPQLAQGELGQYLSRSLTYNGYAMTR